MAVNNLKPIELPSGEREKAFCFYPAAKEIHTDIRKRKLSYLNNNGEWNEDVLLLHWQNMNTETPKYKIEVRGLDDKTAVVSMIFWVPWCFISYFVRRAFLRIKNGLLRRIKKGDEQK